MRANYVTLAEAVVNTVSLIGANPKRTGNALICDNTEEHIERTKGRDWIVMPAHYGCWEYYPLWCWKDSSCDFISVYHPMKSPVFEHFFRRIRNYGDNNFLVTMNDAVRYYVKHRDKGRNMVLGLISDQSPNLRADTEWIEFLNQPTAFIEGGARLATRFGMPIYFVDMERLKADSYKIRYIEIYDGSEQVEPMDIVRRYATHLEAMIRRRPELWMWSHNRWRHTPEKQTRRFGKKKDA
jgi:KDO2-lipid IV(A) lauroyltransferase